MPKKPIEKPVFFTFRALAFALAINYNRLRYYLRSPLYHAIIEPDGVTSDGNPLYLVTRLPEIKADLKLHGLDRKG